MTRTALYRHFDASGRLLYVGITKNLPKRDGQHRAAADWHGDVHHSETQWCLSREHAADLERVAIRHEKPLHNILLTKAAPPRVNAAEVGLSELAEAFCAEVGMPRSTFGTQAVKDPCFLDDLARGREVRSKTKARVLAFIAERRAS